MNFSRLHITVLSTILAAPVLVSAADKPYPPTGTIPYLSAEESLKTFQLPDGYRLETVVSEPHVVEPVVCAFDGNGRMYVAQMRTYMQDADATGEQEPKSQVSWHEDTDGDGKMDRHGVFVDNLLLPRMVLPLDDRVLIQESNTLDIYAYRDTDGDGVADEKKIFFKGGPRGGNMEHQPSGLIWSMDNWLYTTYNAFRLKYQHDGTAVRESIPSNGGQWGLCQDDLGKPWYVNAGGERGPLNFQQTITYGQFNVSDQFSPGYREVFPLVPIPDVQGGQKRFRPEEETLNHFTATCGQEIFRGDRLPKDLRGDLLFAEPVGRLIRRSKIEVKDGVTFLENAHPGSEFIRSTDPNFRPVNMANGPDGCLYIVDMYRGIIQQGNWTKKGSYLRGVIDEYGLDKNVGRGRIYRLVHEDFKPGKAPKMLKESPKEIAKYLDHPNGWWRDTAQKLLIVKNDKSITPQLTKISRSKGDSLDRLHAIWALEGMNAVTPSLLREHMQNESPAMRKAAIRIAESLFKSGNKSLEKDIKKLAGDPDPEVALQALMTAKLLKFNDHKDLIENTMTKNKARNIQEFGKQLLSGGQAPPAKITTKQLALFRKGKEVYQGLCFGCHGDDGKGTPIPDSHGLTLAPSLVNSKIINGHRHLSINVLLHGLTGPAVDGKTYQAEMVPMASNGDEFIAAALSFIRNSFGNASGFVTVDDVAHQRKINHLRNIPWTVDELMESIPSPLTNRDQWKLSASVKEKDVALAVDGEMNTRYSTGGSMKPGMHFTIELPEPTRVAGLILDAGRSKGDYPRGYTVEFSDDGEKWKRVAKGKGKTALTEIKFEPRSTQFIKITQTGSNRLHWSIYELNVLKEAKLRTSFPKAVKKADAFE